MRQERPPPRRLGIAGGPRHHVPGQPAHRAAVVVDQPGLARQRLTLAEDPYDVAVALAQAARREHHDVGGVTEDLGEVLTQASRRGSGVELRLYHDPSAHNAQASGETQQRRHLGLAAARLHDGQPAQLVLHHAGHRHGCDPPPVELRQGSLAESRRVTWTLTKICANAWANRAGSCRGDPSSAATSARASLPPRVRTASSRTSGSSTRFRSASTTSTVSSGAWARRTSRCVCGEKSSVSPVWGAWLCATRRFARDRRSASASSGTLRCGSTLVSHEPGPKLTQSASSPARAASGPAGGSSGTSETRSTLPGVLAQATCPRTRVISSGAAGSAPRTSATMSSGTEAIGSTRPSARSSRPIQSSPATGSSSSSHRATISRLPTAWPCSPPWLRKRCWTTSLHVLPQSSSPQS